MRYFTSIIGLSPILLTAPKRSSLVTTLLRLFTSPQGSVLGPIVLSIYTTPITSTASFSVPQQQYANDTQLCIALFSSNFLGQIHLLKDCLTAVHAWRCRNSQSLNPDKSESVLSGTRQRSHAFTLENHLSMDKHVNDVSRASFYHLRVLRHIRPAITAEEANILFIYLSTNAHINYKHNASNVKIDAIGDRLLCRWLTALLLC